MSKVNQDKENVSALNLSKIGELKRFMWDKY